MVRSTYGPIVVAQPTPSTTDDPTALGFSTAAIPVSRTRGGTPEIDIVTFAAGTANADGTVTPDSATGAVGVSGPDGYQGALYFAGYPVLPNELPDRTGGVSSVTQDGGAAQTGAVTVTSPTWSTIAGKPAVVAAGVDQPTARAAIGAGTSSLALGTSATTARAGNWVPTADDVGAVSKIILPLALGTSTPLAGGDTLSYDAASATFLNQQPTIPQPIPYTLQGVVLNPGQSVPGDFPSGAVVLVRSSAPSLGVTQIAKGGTASSSTVYTVPLTDAAAVGDDVSVTVAAPPSASTLSTITVTDSSGNSYSLRGQRLQGSTVQVQVFKARLTTALTTASTLTVTFTVAVGDIEVNASKIVGLGAAPNLDQQGQNSGLALTSLSVAAGGANAQPNELAILGLGFVGVGNSVVDPSTWAQSGWTQVGATQTSGGTNPKYAATFARLVTAVETTTVTAQVAASSAMVGILNTYKAA